MGIYRERVLPRLIDAACGSSDLAAWRSSIAEGLHGRVVEIGFGSGLNLAHYPAGVDEVLAVEPSAVARRLAEPRIAARGLRVAQIGLDGHHLPIDDASCDGALCTFTLCTVADPELALAELRRVLRPGARLHLLEHGRSPDADVARWQRRLEPIQRRLADGCHLTRDPDRLVEAAGFRMERCEQRYARGPRPYSWLTAAVAQRPE